MSTTMQAAVGFGPLPGLPTFWNKSDLTTAAVKVTLPTLPGTLAGGQPPMPSSNVKVKIYNYSTTATIAWALATRAADGTSSAPAMTADAGVTGVSPIGPLGVEIFTIPADKDLYVIASAAATSVHVTSFLFL